MKVLKSNSHKWLIWVSKNDEHLTDNQRYRDSKNNYPILVPPTNGNRIDVIPFNSCNLSGYEYGFKGLVVIIEDGMITNLYLSDE